LARRPEPERFQNLWREAGLVLKRLWCSLELPKSLRVRAALELRPGQALDPREDLRQLEVWLRSAN
jgi:hypothetical protein